MTALPGYDAWRTPPPWDMPGKRARFAPETVTTPLFIEAGELTMDAEGEYDATTGTLVTVVLNGLHLPVHEVAAMLKRFAPH